MTNAKLAALLVAAVASCLAAASLRIAASPRAAPGEVAAAEGPPRRLAEIVAQSERYAQALDVARDMAEEVFGRDDGGRATDVAARAVRHLYEQTNLGGKVRAFRRVDAAEMAIETFRIIGPTLLLMAFDVDSMP